MITIVAKITLKVGTKAEFMTYAKALVEKSNQEVGCHSYQLFEDIKDENIVTFIEEWQDMAAIESHNKSEHFTQMLPIFDAYKAQPLEISLYQKVL